MAVEISEQQHGHLAVVGAFVVLSAILVLSKIISTFYLNELRHVPGPKLNALSRIPYARHMINQTTVDQAVDLHKRYGDVVRLTPNEVSFTSIDTAFTDIYGFRTGKLKGHLNMPKDPVWYPKPANGTPSIILANDEAHSRTRRTLSHAFSEKALQEQEPLLQEYVDQLVNGLKRSAAAGKGTPDMTAWYNWTTFDIISDLLFGEPLGSLQRNETHKWITLLLEAIGGFSMFYLLTYFPWMKRFGSTFVDKDIMSKRVEFQAWISSQVTKRIERKTTRPDFMQYILEHNGQKGEALTRKEIDSNANVLLTAGSETTATLLSGATFLLLDNPAKLQKLQAEIRGAFARYDDITIDAVNRQPYLIAVLAESLRYFPPVPCGFERRVGKGGEMVSGYFMPEGTALSVSHYAAYHSPKNFTDPDDFVPERWMGEERYADDKRAWCQPFSFGQRNCLGKNLAYAEMRLILAKMVWTFDWELDAQSHNWLRRCTVKTLWRKPKLLVKMTEVARA